MISRACGNPELNVKSKRLQGDFKRNVFHNPVQANILNFISCICIL